MVAFSNLWLRDYGLVHVFVTAVIRERFAYSTRISFRRKLRGVEGVEGGGLAVVQAVATAGSCGEFAGFITLRLW